MKWPRYWRRTTGPARALPTFIIIGANKGGTTSLWRYLDQHPDVFMSRNKEPMYFSNSAARIEGRPDNELRSEAVQTWAEYLRLFEPGRSALAVGEASTSYLCNPSAPARIHAQLPAVGLLAMLRNPFDRAFSAFQMYRRLGMETLSFPEAIEAELVRLDRPDATGKEWRTYLRLGFYGSALHRYLERFPRQQLGIHLYEELESGPRELVSDLYRFIGVDPSFRPDVDRRYNAAATHEAPEWDPRLRDRFLDHIGPDIEMVERVIDRDLPRWRGPTPS